MMHRMVYRMVYGPMVVVHNLMVVYRVVHRVMDLGAGKTGQSDE
jgi:hypothetical protein